MSNLIHHWTCHHPKRPKNKKTIKFKLLCKPRLLWKNLMIWRWNKRLWRRKQSKNQKFKNFSNHNHVWKDCLSSLICNSLRNYPYKSKQSSVTPYNLRKLSFSTSKRLQHHSSNLWALRNSTRIQKLESCKSLGAPRYLRLRKQNTSNNSERSAKNKYWKEKENSKRKTESEQRLWQIKTLISIKL